MSIFLSYSQARGAIHDLQHAQGLSSERVIPLLVSARVLYILQNLANLDVAMECRYAVQLGQGGFYRLTPEDPQYGLYLELVSEVGYQLREFGAMWMPGDIKPVGYGIVQVGDPPYDWLECDGTPQSRTIYANLFGAIGTTFGAGDGSTTFNLPNLKGRSPQGWDDTEPTGSQVGVKMQTLIPQHNHILDAYVGTSSGFYLKNSNLQGTLNHPYTGWAGEAGGVDQRGPRLALSFLIKT